MMRKKQKLTEAHEVPADGRPTEVKVGYRTLRIKYVNPSFILDDMTDCADKSAAILRGMKYYMR